MATSPTTLYFSGDQVATFTGVDDDGTNSIYHIDETPFKSTDIIEIIEIIEIIIDNDSYDNADGEFDLSQIEYTSIRVFRDGEWYDLSITTGDQIQSTSGTEITEQGDSFFTSDATIGPSAAGTPFDNIPDAQYVFSTTTSFTAGTDATLERDVDGDFNLDGDTSDTDETGDGNFNVNFGTLNFDGADVTFVEVPAGDSTLKGGDYVNNENDTQYVILTDGGEIDSVHFANWGKAGPSNPGEGPGGDDQFHINLRAFDDDFNITMASMDEGDTFFFTNVDSFTFDSEPDSDVLVYTINYTGSDGQPHTVIIDLFSGVTDKYVGIDITLACFAKGTSIETDHGPKAVEDLKLGDFIMCGDGKHRPIQWVASRHIDGTELSKHPEFRPIRIRKGSLGQNRPSKDLVVSPQHRVLVGDWQVELMFGAEDVLIPAKYLINGNAIDTDFKAKDVSYYHFMFDSHQTVFSTGTETESFHPSDMALGSIDDAARDELFDLFPELKTNPAEFGPTCLPVLKSFEAEALLGAIG